MTRRLFKCLATLGLMTMLAAAAQAEGLEGLWAIEGTPDGAPEPAFTNLARMDKDGTMVNIDPWYGTGLGQWEKVGALPGLPVVSRRRQCVTQGAEEVRPSAAFDRLPQFGNRFLLLPGGKQCAAQEKVRESEFR